MRKKITQIIFGLLGAAVFGLACSQNPQLPSEKYQPQLVVFGVLAPGSYSLPQKFLYPTLRYNFLVVQRTLKKNERLILLPMTQAHIFLDSIQLEKVGDFRQGIYTPQGGEFEATTPIYSFDQKKNPVQAGKTYTVRVTAAGYEPISASTTVPEKPVILEPATSTISLASGRVHVKWKKAAGAAGYRIEIRRSQSIAYIAEDEEWLDKNTNHYDIFFSDFSPMVGDTLWLDVQAVDQQYVHYFSLREKFFSACLTQKDFNVKNGLGVLGSLNQDQKVIVFTQ